MRIFLLNIKGTGIDLKIGKSSKNQDIKLEEINKDKNPVFKLFGTLDSDTIIDVINDDGELHETFSYNDLESEEADSFKTSFGTFYLKESYHKGLFYQFEVVIENEDNFNPNLILIKTKEYNGEQYVYSLKYDGYELESIDTITTIKEEKINYFSY